MGSPVYDLAVIGGGVMGCTAALRLAQAGMRVVIVEARSGICTQASGINTGHIDVMGGRTYRVPYVLESIDLWRNAGEWLGADAGFRERNGLKVAFTEADEEELASAVHEMRAQGATLEMVPPERARQLEPGLSGDVRAAAWSPRDGYANPLLIARAFKAAAPRHGLEIRLDCPVSAIEAGPPFRLETATGPILARRLLVATGVGIGQITQMLGVDLAVRCRVSQVTVTERQPPIVRTALNTASDTLSLKQVDNGTVLIGGGWQGIGSLTDGPREIIPENMIGNLQLACATIPALAKARVVRTWLGLEARAADNLPLAGPLPGIPDGWVLGAVHTGFALSPSMGLLMARAIEGTAAAPSMFDPGRFSGSPAAVAAWAPHRAGDRLAPQRPNSAQVHGSMDT